MIKFKDEFNSESTTNKLSKMLTDLVAYIDDLKAMEVGINVSVKPSAMDIVLTADFDNESGLDNYRIHPEHVKVLDYLSVVKERAQVVDYFT